MSSEAAPLMKILQPLAFVFLRRSKNSRRPLEAIYSSFVQSSVISVSSNSYICTSFSPTYSAI